jgi:hypothetical protein
MVLKNIGKKISSFINPSDRFISGSSSVAGAIGNAGNKISSSKSATLALMGAAGAAGFANTAGPAVMDATMDVAFGTPDADRYFTGRDLSLRGAIGASAGGPLGGALMATSPGDFFAVNPTIPSPVVTAPLFGTVGSGIGAMAGSGVKGRIAGGIIGGIAGAGVGFVAPAIGAANYVRNNSQFFSQSPYAPSSARAYADLNATGDVVLGMHNARRGY